MISIGEATTEDDFDALRTLLQEYAAWASELTAGTSITPTDAAFKEELATLPGPYARPDGRLLIARVDREAAGCLALKRHGAAEAELKRLYVVPARRGMKIGRRLVTTILDEARAAGYRRVVLDSHVNLTSAHVIIGRPDSAIFRRHRAFPLP